MDLKIIGYAADSILEVFVAKINRGPNYFIDMFKQSGTKRGVDAEGGIQNYFRQGILGSY